MRPFDATRLPTVICGDFVTPSRIASKLPKEPTGPQRILVRLLRPVHLPIDAD